MFVGTHQSPQQVVKCWTKPINSYLKVNWNAAVATRETCIGLGCIIRDDEGAVQLSACNNIQSSLMHVVTEAKAWRFAVFIVKDLQLS